MFLIKVQNNVNQQSGEGLIEWKIRLMLGKGMGLFPEYSWKDLANIVEPERKCESHFADQAKGMLELANFLTSENEIDLKSLKQLQMLEQKKMDLERQKIQLSDVKNRNRQYIREHARFENIAKQIEDSLKKWGSSNKISCVPKYNNTTENEAILLLSDWHYGQTTSNSINEFNVNVVEHRLQELVTQVSEYTKMFKVSKLHVFMLGDMINGLIHVTSRINASENIAKQTVEGTHKILNLLFTLKDLVPTINVYGVRGNHDRMTPNLKESVVEESFFDIMYQMIKYACKDKKGINIVENDIESEIITTNICNKNIIAVHGDKDRPKKAIENLMGMTQIIPDYIFMGHFHHQEEYERFNTKVIVNGSFCGTDAFAHSKRLISKPSQNLIILNTKGLFCKIDINFNAGVYINNESNTFKKY